MSNIQKKQNYDYCQGALELKKNLEYGFLKLGEMLYKIKMEEKFTAGWESWDEFQMELKMSSATISKLIRIYEIYVVQYGFTQEKLYSAGGWSVLAETLPVVSTKKEAEYWLSEVPNLTLRDVRVLVQEKKNEGTEKESCTCENTYTVVICKDCGHSHQVHETNR